MKHIQEKDLSYSDHPLIVRPYYVDDEGVFRFQPHPWIKYAVDVVHIDLNEYIYLPGTTPEDIFTFYQQMGCSFSGIMGAGWCTDLMHESLTSIMAKYSLGED